MRQCLECGTEIGVYEIPLKIQVARRTIDERQRGRAFLGDASVGLEVTFGQKTQRGHGMRRNPLVYLVAGARFELAAFGL